MALDLSSAISAVNGVTNSATNAVGAVGAITSAGVAAAGVATVLGAINQFTDVNSLLCGENGVFTEIKKLQDTILDQVMLGKNFIAAIDGIVTQAETFIDAIQNAPDVVESILQQTVLNLISEQALRNPEGVISDILALRAAYQNAGPAVEQIIDNVERFIADPLNTPLDVCNSIPNLIKVGDTFVEFPKKALQPDPSKTPESIIESFTKELGEIFDNAVTKSEDDLKIRFEQTIPTSPKFPLPDVSNDIAISGRTPISIAYTLEPGSAHRAAVAQSASVIPPTSSTPVVGDDGRTSVTPPTSSTSVAGRSPSDIQNQTRNVVPPPSLANPFPEGRQFVAQDFAPSKYAKSIATKLNSLNPSVRGRFAAGIQDYISSNFPERDINVTEGYRSPERSAQLAASGIKAAGAGKSWHNYGSAMDVAIYVNGKYDDGRRGPSEYVGLARASMQKFGLVNDLKGDSGHFYPASFGAGVPKAIQQGSTTVASYAKSKGLNDVPQTTLVASASTTTSGSTEVIDIRSIQSKARGDAIDKALAEGKTIQEAESLGQVAGNNAGTEAFKKLA
jgi:predicted RNase H-like HicB family nuclease